MVTTSEYDSVLLYTVFVGAFIWITSIVPDKFLRLWTIFGTKSGKDAAVKLSWFHWEYFYWGLLKGAASILLIPALYFNVQRNPAGVAAHHRNWEIASWSMYAAIVVNIFTSVSLHHAYNIFYATIMGTAQVIASMLCLAYLGVLGSSDTNSYTSFWFFLPWAIVSTAHWLAILNVSTKAAQKILKRFANIAMKKDAQVTSSLIVVPSNK